MRTLLSTQSTKGPRAPTLTSRVPGNRTLLVIPVISRMPLISTRLAWAPPPVVHRRTHVHSHVALSPESPVTPQR